MDPRILLQRIILEAEAGEQLQTEAHLERLEQVVRRFEPGPNVANSCLAVASPLAISAFGIAHRVDAAKRSIAAVLSSPSATPFFAVWAKTGAGLLAVLNEDIWAATEQYAELKPSAGLVLVHISVDRVLGLLAGTMGNLDDAVTHFRDAYSFHRKAGYRPELAWTCYDYATALLKRGGPDDREQAVYFLNEGLSIASELNMAPLIERVAATQYDMDSKAATDPAYPDGLTGREVEVLRLVAAGKSNRDIAEELVITMRTAGNHVSNILNKTGLANRTEAAAYAIRQDLV